MINSVKIMSRMGRMRSYFLLEEVNNYLIFRNSISYKEKYFHAELGAECILPFRIKIWVGNEISPSF